MPENKDYIVKVKLSDNSVYYLKDSEALRLSGGILTGDLIVDAKIKTNKLYIMEISYGESPVNNVLYEDETTHEIKKRSADNLLADIGGISCGVDETSGTLSLKLGK